MPRANGKFNSKAAALDWLERGIKPIPIKPKGKRPKINGWPDLRITKANAADYFKRGDNIGGLWGKPSSWIVDVDLDDEDAADFAEFLLPPTVIFGRGNRPDTHFLYRSKNAETKKWKGPKGNMLVELRSTGTQTVLPPSIHPEGDRYENSEDSQEEITVLSAAKLNRYLNEIAVGAIFLKHFPKGGSRHDYIHAVTGALLFSKWKPTDVKRFMWAMVQTLQDEDDDPKQRLRTIVSTIESFNKRGKVAAWPTLKDWINADDILLLKSWINEKDTSTLPPIPKATVIKAVKKPQGLKFDRALMDIPGLVGTIAKWAAMECYRKQPSFDLATALMCTAMASRNKYEVIGWNTPLQPYFMLVAPTAQGKGAPLKFTSHFAATFKLDRHIVSGFQSHQALMHEFKEADNQLCWLWDEAGRNLKSASNTNSQEFQIISHLISLYGQANGRSEKRPGRGQDIEAVEHPFFTVLANSQPGLLVDAITSVNLSSGFLNRILLFDSSDQIPEKNRERRQLVPSKVKTHVNRIIKHPAKKQGFIPVEFANTATFNLLDKFEDFATEQSLIDEQWSRALQNALVVAGIVAVGVNEKRPKITAEIATWAIKLVSWSVRSWSIRVENFGMQDEFAMKMKLVEEIIQDPTRHIKAHHKAAQISYMRKGITPRSVLMRLVRFPRYILDDILDQLVAMEVIHESVAEDGKTTLFSVKQ